MRIRVIWYARLSAHGTFQFFPHRHEAREAYCSSAGIYEQLLSTECTATSDVVPPTCLSFPSFVHVSQILTESCLFFIDYKLFWHKAVLPRYASRRVEWFLSGALICRIAFFLFCTFKFSLRSLHIYIWHFGSMNQYFALKFKHGGVLPKL